MPAEEALAAGRFGHFDDDRREYVITRPDTPLPWINYLGTERLFSIVTNTGGGYAFFRDARMRRLLRYRYNDVPEGTGGRFLYLRDEAGVWWSPTGRPARAALEDLTCRHGLGSSTISSVYRGIEAAVTYFVPPGADVEVWRIRLTNRRPRPAGLTLFPAVEFALWDAWDDQANFQRNYSTGEVAVIDGVVYHVTEYRERRNHFSSFACSEPAAGFDTDRRAFLGNGRGWDAPEAVERGTASGSIAHGWSPIAALQVPVGLGPDETRDVVVTLGYHENPPDAKWDDRGRVAVSAARRVVAAHLDPAGIDGMLEALAARWDGLLGALRVETPDEHTDRMVNTWNPAQCMTTFNLSRSASLFESGIGRGMGFRDSNQDLLGFVHMAPEAARERLADLAATQLPDGGAFHQYQPLTKRGNDAVGSGFNDDPLWLVLAAAAYVKESGDPSLLEEAAPYANTPGTEAPIRDHLRRALQYTRDRLGPRGLPLIGRADWNDCLNLNTFSTEPGESFQTHAVGEGRVAESVFIAGLFVLASGEMAALEERFGDPEAARRCRADAAAMEARVLEHGWDGGWFLRAYDAAGTPLGTAGSPEGSIFLEPQGMCPMAGIGLADGRAARALDAVEERLATEHGIALVRPPFSQYRPELGEISTYPPGYKENGGIFCHANPWAMIAAAKLGDGDRAFDWYTRINPSAREARSDVHRCEPYVYAQMIAGPDAPTHGEAKNSWLTGTAAWNYVAVTQWILGVRPDHDGLAVEPVLPSHWDGFRMTRRFRGAVYDITVERGAGERAMTVDGAPAAGTVVPAAPPGRRVTVSVTIPG
jgi:cellobiose phosphorylase